MVKTVTKDQKKYYKEVLADGGEGVMMKKLDSTYTEGIRSHEWLKIKQFKTADVIVVGATKGKGARKATFGALILAEKRRDGSLKYVGKASGFSEKDARMLLEHVKKHSRKTSPFTVDEAKGTGTQVQDWCKPDMMIEVKYFEKTKSGKLRFPAFVRVRDDKTP